MAKEYENGCVGQDSRAVSTPDHPCSQYLGAPTCSATDSPVGTPLLDRFRQYQQNMPSTQHHPQDESHPRTRSSYHSSHSHISRRRSRSPRHTRRRDDGRSRSPKVSPKNLPFDARPISKHDLSRFRPMFGLYLDIQKKLVLEELSEDEVRGRWKSFLGKW